MPRALALLILLVLASSNLVSAAPAQWLQVSSSHFTVITDSNDKQARHILDQFERMRWLFQTLFPNKNVDPAQPILVIAARNEKSFRALEPPAYLAKGQLDLAGLFLRTPEKNYVLLRVDAPYEHPFATIYHEYTHLQFSDAIHGMPLWLNEGFAEFVENTEIRSKDVLLGEPNPALLSILQQNPLLPLVTLFRVDRHSPYYHEEEKGSIFYAEAWALTHYLNITDSGKSTHRIQEYMALVDKGTDPVLAAEQAFGDLKRLQENLEDYIRRGCDRQFILSTVAAPIDESSYKSRTLSEDEASTLRAAFLANAQRSSGPPRPPGI
jgi:hypothetical protein